MHNIIQATAIMLMKKKATKNIEPYIGRDSIMELCRLISDSGHNSVFIASSKTVYKKGMLENFISMLNSKGIKTTVYTDIVPDPTITNVEEGVGLLLKEECDCIVAVGGGSVIDCAKVISLRATNPKLTVKKLSFYLCKSKKSLPVYIVPTTSGTGSEITYFSVITDEVNKKKLAVLSDKCLPDGIAFDYNLLKTVPKNPTIYSGLDALTHSVESYISSFSKAFEEDTNNAPKVVRSIFDNLPIVAEEPDNYEARMEMAKAAYHAGINFRKASVGYVHAIAHRIGETYHIPHGFACAVVLPHVLKHSLSDCRERLDQMAVESGLAGSAEKFIEKIVGLENQLGIELKIEQINEADYTTMIKRILSEAKLQGCPKMLKKDTVRQILEDLKKGVW